MASRAQKKLVVRIEGNTKHFEISMDKSKEAMKRFRKETQKTHGSTQVLAKGFQHAASQASVLHGPLNGISGRLNAIGTAMRITSLGWVALGGVVSAASLAFVHGNRVMAETERQVARLNAVLKATDGAAGIAVESLDRFAREVAMNTLASTNQVRDAIGILGTFRSVSGETFKDAIRLSQDMAEVMGTSITSGATMMGKALENPLTGLTALNRAGVTFSETQKTMIENAMATGDIFAAQEVIMDGVRSQLEGIAEAVADQTQSGAIDTLGQSWDEFAETVARASGVAELFKKALNAISSEMQRISRMHDASLYTDKELATAIDEQRKLIEQYFQESVHGSQHFRQMALDMMRMHEIELARLLDESAKRTVQGIIARIDGELQAQEVARKARQEAYAKAYEVYEKAEEKLYRLREKYNKAAAGGNLATANVDRVNEQYKVELDRLNRYHEEQREALAGQHSLLLDLETQYLEAKNALMEAWRTKWAEADQKDKDDALKREEQYRKDALEHIKEHKETIEAQYELAAAAIDAVGTAFGEVGKHMEEGSKAQKAFFTLQKSVAAASAIVSTFQAATHAMAGGFPDLPSKLAAYTAVITQGMAAVSAISAVSLSARAGGGPVTAGGSYWVGEHGPEVMTPSVSGHITSNEALTPNVNVNIIEDASRAGTVNQEGDMLNVYVAAAISQLTQDFNNGRGLFGAMENKYGLTRR